MRTAVLRCAVLLSLLALPAALSAQSINLDLGYPQRPAPDDTYRGVGLSGTWNKIDALDAGNYPLVGLDGQSVLATVYQIGGTEIQEAPLSGPGNPTGDDATMLKDALITHTSIENCLFFDDMQQGTYEVLTYAWMPTAPLTPIKVRIDFNAYEPIVGGAWSGEHGLEITFARHFVDVDASGFLGVHTGVPAGGDFGVGAALNGVQLRKLEPEPPLFPRKDELSWLASLDAVGYDVVQGDLGLLLSSSGNFSLASQNCLANNIEPTTNGYPADPAPGEAQWFLVRGVLNGGNASYDSPGSSQVGGRDLEIRFSGVGCE